MLVLKFFWIYFIAAKKIWSRSIPHNLAITQKKVRVDWCKALLEKYNGGVSKNVYKIVTGDESWIYACEPPYESWKTNQI